MRYKALKSFCGVVSMTAGDVREISDTSLAGDLEHAGYIISIEDEVAEPKTEPKKRGRKKNG